MSIIPCTEVVAAGRKAGTLCGKACRTFTDAGEPRCGWHSRSKASSSGEYQLEPETGECTLRCSCGAVSVVALPGDAPAKQVLASMSCPTCGRAGALKLGKSR